MADDHGSTAAAWTAVAIIIVAFIVGGVAIILANWTLFWICVAAAVAGGLVGKIGGVVRGGVPPR